MQANEDADGTIDPIERLVEEIQVSLQHRMFSVALMATMALVDICAALESPDGQTDRSKFKTWFATNVPREIAYIDPADAYQLRCGLLHQGHMRGANYDLIIFTLPNNSGTVLHGNIFQSTGGSALNLDVRIFVNDLLGAIGRWWIGNRANDPVRANADALARIRKNGLPPHIVGMPVIG